MQITIDTQTPKRIAKKLAAQIERDPMLALTVAGIVLGGSAQFVNANTRRVNAKTARKNSATWAKEVNRRSSK